MKRLLQSSNFWNAVIGLILITLAYKYANLDTSVLLSLIGLFGVRGIATGMQDYASATKKELNETDENEWIGGRPKDR